VVVGDGDGDGDRDGDRDGSGRTVNVGVQPLPGASPASQPDAQKSGASLH
jgi:hypothetical protein